MTTPHVLFVDDDEITRIAAAEFLRDEGFAVAVARDGVEALAIFGHETTRLVITDLQMPRMDGHTLLRNLRELSPATPVVVITAHAMIDAGREADRLGADGFLNKPLILEEILAIVQGFLTTPEPQ